MVIALLTDFGTRDYFVGAMKGAILSINPDVQIVDITHEIPPQDIRCAAFTLCACYEDFPEKTIFVAVVDPGVGSERRAILVETEKYYFIAPDNGLLSLINDVSSPRVSKGVEEDGEKRRRGDMEKVGQNSAASFLESALAHARASVFELTNERFFRHQISRTFHGRDIFAPVAAHLSVGVKPNEFGRKTGDFIRFEIGKPRKISGEKIKAEIIHIDRFGNLITNLRREDLPEKFSIEINGKLIDKMQNIYAEATDGELFMIFGSAGFLEIAAMQNSASKLLNGKSGDMVLVSEII